MKWNDEMRSTENHTEWGGNIAYLGKLPCTVCPQCMTASVLINYVAEQRYQSAESAQIQHIITEMLALTHLLNYVPALEYVLL